MKRTSLALDADLLNEAARVLGAKTYSAAVNTALAEIVRIRRIQSIPSFFGKGLWQGNLAQVRDDRVRRVRRSAGARFRSRTHP